MKKRLTWAALAAASVMLSGCYTVLQGPRMASSIDNASFEDPYYSDQVYSDLTDGYPEVETVRPGHRNDPWAYDGYGNGYPVTNSGYGVYGFGSPFAYGPSLGASYPYGGYSSAYGPNGYGYDPYYSGRRGSSYTPPGYQLVTSQDLAELRLENAALRAASASGTGARPATSQQDALRRRQAQAEQAWTQRTGPRTRQSKSGYRTPRPASTTSTKPKVSSTTSSKPASSGSKTSRSDTPKRKKKRR
jgi:hypothetical protein